jgi:pimeloyl-ACP methyl ester carboxylesterase
MRNSKTSRWCDVFTSIGLVIIVTLAFIPLAAGQTPIYADKLNLLVYLDSAGNSHPVRTVADWETRRSHILLNMQKVMGPLPQTETSNLDLQILVTEEVAGIRRLKITFRSEGEDRVPAFLLLPGRLGKERKSPGILCLHQTTDIGKGEPAGLGGNPNLQYALELAERGFVTLAPDYPNFGDYKIDVYSRGYISATMKGIVNHKRAIDLLQSLPEVDSERIAVIGHSLGGHNALFVAAFDPRIKAIVTSCGFNSFMKYSGGNLAGWSHKGYMPRIAEVYACKAAQMPFDFTEILGCLAPRPLFINAPLRDENFEVSGVRDCVRAAQPIYQKIFRRSGNLKVIYPSCGHDFPAEVRHAAYQFLARSLAFNY